MKKTARVLLIALVTVLLNAAPAAAGPGNGDRCKNGGWENLETTNMAAFKNQGDCVSYVSNGGVLVVPCLPGDGSCWV
jgi:hypothetical protein